MATRFSPGTLLVTIVLLFLIFNPGSSPSSDFEDGFVQSVLDREWQNFNVTRDAALQDLANAPSINLTGLHKEDGFYWNRLAFVRDLARVQLDFATDGQAGQTELDETSPSLLVYRNVSGWANGHWVRSAMAIDYDQEAAINRSAFESRIIQSGRPLTHNITGNGGKFSVSLRERNYEEASPPLETDFGDLHARISLQDDSSSADGWEFMLKGVHDRRSGSVLLASTSENFAGVFALPHFAISAHSFDRIKSYLLRSLNNTITRQEKHLDTFTTNPWGESSRDAEDLPPSATCQLIVYLQQFVVDVDGVDLGEKGQEDQDALRSFAAQVLQSVEDNLSRPQGLFLPATPPMHFVATVFSPDCGYVLESKGPPGVSPDQGKHLYGIKYEVRIQRSREALVAFIIVLTCQLLLLMHQIGECSTPSKRSRVSFGTITMLSLGSGFVSFAALLLSSAMARLLVLSMSIAFFSFTDGLFFSMRFLLDVWTVQEPERLERRRSEQTTTTNRPQESTPENAPLLPTVQAPAGLIEGAMPIPIPLTQPAPTIAPNNGLNIARPQATFGSVYTRYCLSLLFFAFFSIWVALSWPQTLRTFYANTLAFFYLSFWVPQIYRNVMRNCRKAFTRRFIIGQSILRLVPIAYFWAYEDNVLFAETDLVMLSIYVVWLWLQILILLFQDIIGPRFFVSESWRWIPIAYNYHPVLREDEEGVTLPVGFEASSPAEERTLGMILDTPPKSKTRGKKTFDCAICMGKIEVPVLSSSDTSASESKAVDVLKGGFLSRRLYAVTPCRHLFHSNCLESWMSYRLQCPICRESLPPL